MPDFKAKMHQIAFGGRAPPGPAVGAYSAPADEFRALPLKAFQTKNAANVVWRLGSARTRWETLQRSPDL